MNPQPTTPGSPTLLLIRHAQTDLTGTFCGHTDPPLNHAGHTEAEALAQTLAHEPIQTILTSDLRRATETAAPLAAALGLTPTASPALREIHFGAWEALRWPEIEVLDPLFAQRWLDHFPHLTPPGGEPFADFRLRVLNELSSILRLAQHGTVAVVTHAGPLRAMLEARGIPTEQAWHLSKPHATPIRLPLSHP